MSNSVNNLVRATKNVFNAAITTVSVTAELLGDGTELLNSTIKQAPKVTGAVLTTPFAATKGYHMEASGMSEEEAEAKAYRYLRQELSVTIEEVGVGSGKLLADLLKEDDIDVVLVNKEVTTS